MPVLPQASSRGQISSPTTLAQPIWSFSSPTNPFNPAEVATFRVLGLDSDFLADVINEDLREELFDMIARLAKLLSQIPSDERTETLVDLWLTQVKQQVINERSMQIAQELASDTFASSDREAADALVQLGPNTRFQFWKHQDEAVIAMLPPELAAEYRRAMASVDLKSLSSRFFSQKGPNAEHVALRVVLKRKFEEQGNMDRERETYHPWALAAICDSIPSIDHWSNHITDAFVARDWKFGLWDGEVVLEIANGRDENLLAWFRENCSERFIRNRIMEMRRKAQQTLRQMHEDERLLGQHGVQAFLQANPRASAGEGNV